MTTTHHFTKTEAIQEAKRRHGVDFKAKVSLYHNGAFWVLVDL